MEDNVKLYKYGVAILLLVVGYPLWNIIYNLPFYPLREYPGPKLFAACTFTIYYYRVRGLGAKVVPALHEKYGPIVRISPNELSYIKSQAWKDIFGHRTGGKPSFPKDPVQLGPNPPGSASLLLWNYTAKHFHRVYILNPYAI